MKLEEIAGRMQEIADEVRALMAEAKEKCPETHDEKASQLSFSIYNDDSGYGNVYVAMQDDNGNVRFLINNSLRDGTWNTPYQTPTEWRHVK